MPADNDVKCFETVTGCAAVVYSGPLVDWMFEEECETGRKILIHARPMLFQKSEAQLLVVYRHKM